MKSSLPPSRYIVALFLCSPFLVVGSLVAYIGLTILEFASWIRGRVWPEDEEE